MLSANRFMDNHLHTASNVTEGMLEACFFGFNQPYQKTLSHMHRLHALVAKNAIPNQLMMLEHEPVITITRQHLLKSVTTSERAIRKSGIELCLADRGGDATFHGPGQLVGYPIIALGKTGESSPDIASYMRSLERALLDAMHALGLRSLHLIPGFTGIWAKTIDSQDRITCRKLIAIGVGVKDGVSKHGFAINISIDHARYEEHIVPCGLKDRGVITLKELFSMESLEMPELSVIVQMVGESLSKTFSLTLVWRETGDRLGA